MRARLNFSINITFFPFEYESQIIKTLYHHKNYPIIKLKCQTVHKFFILLKCKEIGV